MYRKPIKCLGVLKKLVVLKRKQDNSFVVNELQLFEVFLHLTKTLVNRDRLSRFCTKQGPL